MKEEEIKKKHAERSIYIGDLTDKVVDAIEDVFGSTDPKPTGNDMIDTVAFSSVLLFARQIHAYCKSKTTMRSVMRSTIWALTSQINALADPLIKYEEEWSRLLESEEGEGGENGK